MMNTLFWDIFLLLSLCFISYSFCEECPRDKPILKNNECVMEYCTPEEFENKTCIISNSLQNIQWMNNFHLFGDYYLSHVCPISNEKGEVFLMSQSMAFGDGDKYLFGFFSNGDGLFYDAEKDYHYSFTPIDFQGRTYPEIFKYVENNKKGYLLSTTFDEYMYLIDYVNKNYTELKVDLISQYSDTIFKLKDYEEETYFTDFIYCDKKYNFNECWINLRIFKFNETKVETILDSPDKINVCHKTKIQCFQTEKNYIQCIYTTEETSNEEKVYNHVLSLFNSKTLQKEYDEIIENNFNIDSSFDFNLQLKENVFVIGYSYPNDKNIIKLMLKKLVIEDNKLNLENYIPSIDYININGDNYYTIKNGTAKRNTMIKISENKFSILINDFKEEAPFTYGNKKLIIIMCTIYNNEQNLDIRYYTINFLLYERKLIDDLKGFTLNDYFGVLLETDHQNKNQAVFMTFGYVNSTYDETKIDDNLKLNNTNSTIKFSNYITGIENNLFGYELLGVKIIELPSEKDAGYFVHNENGKKIEKNEIFDIDTEIKFIVTENYKSNIYNISFAAIVQEPDYDILCNLSEKEENYPLNSQESYKNFYTPKVLIGKQVNYKFSLLCYNSCLSCYEISDDPQDHKCRECKPNYYFLKDTFNCFSELEGHYVDQDSKVFLPCYSRCKTCLKKEDSSIKMNCQSCFPPYKFYARSTNCLSCPKLVNYEQTDCLDELPEGYFIDDDYLGTIGKCHEYCKTCDDYPTYWSMNCIECKYNDPTFIPIYEGDCPSDDYYDYEEEDYGEEEYLGGECPRDKPIYKKNKDCSDDYCSETDFINKQCIIANLIVKEQWLNNFHNFGYIDVSYVSAELGLNNELFLLAQSQKKENKEKYLFAFDSNGEGLFKNESSLSLKYSFKKLEFNYDDYVDSIKYVKDFDNKNEYLLSTQFGEKMYLFDYSKENAVSKESTFDTSAYSTDTIFQIDDDTFTYFTDFISCIYDDPSDHCYIIMRKFIIENRNIKVLNEVKGNITVSSNNKLTCLFSEFDFVQCTYTTQEKQDSKYIYNHVIGFYNEETFEYLDSFTLKENFDTNAAFDSMISLKEKENIFVIAYSSDDNIITVLLKRIGYNTDFSEIVMVDYIKEIPYINIDGNNLYTFKRAKSDRNSLFKLNDNKFALILNNFKNSGLTSNQANGIVIFIVNIYNDNKNVNVRHYTINFKMYNTFVEGDIRPYLLNDFFGIVIELTSPLDRSLSRSSFFTFGYVNSTSIEIDEAFISKGLSESKLIKINEYITGIENNLFGYEFLGVKIVELPDETKSGYFINAKNNTKIKVDDIVSIDTELKFIVNQNAESNLYRIIIAGLVREPDYNKTNKFAEKVESFPADNITSEEPFYSPKTIMGKKFIYTFTIGDFKICHKNCKKCESSSINEDDQKCLECNNGYYFKEGTKNCYDKIEEHYYFNEETQVFSPCYKDCLTCNNKETNTTHMNCLSCENNLNYYKKSTNCLKCDKYINYLQTECINTIPEGFFLLDKNLGIIEKCHHLCKTCNQSSETIDGTIHMNCLTCLYTNTDFNPRFEGDCPESGKNEENNNDKNENYSSSSNAIIWVIVVIVVVLIILVLIFIFYRKNKNNDIDYKKIKGKVISMEEEAAINED